MSRDFFRALQLPLSYDDFQRLPRHPAYKYDYIDGRLWLTPRPRWFHAALDLRTYAPPDNELRGDLALRPLRPDDWGPLVPTFAASFHGVQPYESLDDGARREAARQCLEATRGGEDGPLIEPACFVAVDADDGRPRGAVLVTLIPDVDLESLASCRWPAPAPPDAVRRRLGKAHLTWAFVGPRHAGHGVGTTLLAAAAGGLLGLGYTHLYTTFLLGNESSAMWHWRNGFRLLAYPGSWRQLRRRMEDETNHRVTEGTETRNTEKGSEQ
jgi:GNAT superfamily N-acetyltransferase